MKTTTHTTTYKEICEAANLTFVSVVNSPVKLKSNEYFALMVIDDSGQHNPHIKGIDPHSHERLIGVECTSGSRFYISKEYNKRRSQDRGTTIIVVPQKEIDENNYCIL